MATYNAPIQDMMFLFEKLRDNPHYNSLDKYKEVLEKQMISKLIDQKNTGTLDKFIESEAKSKILDKIEMVDKYGAIIEEY